MKLVAYLRVSTGVQAEEGLGLEVQEQTIRRWAASEKHEIMGTVTDAGISGTKELESRHGLATALEMIRFGEAEGVVVYRLDRLARDLVLQEQLLAEIRRLKGDVFTTSGAEAGFLADDPDDPSRKLIRQILGAVSEYERAMIALRLRSGRIRKGDKGGYAHGAPRLGYKAHEKALRPDENEQRTLGRITQLKKQGISLREMARTLTEEGFQPKRSTRWHPESLRLILARIDAGEDASVKGIA